ncbi:MAG: GGDEF domain-containing protein [Treponema sp.]|nr:GGDEF domain-containing protein [Treponema sp.]
MLPVFPFFSPFTKEALDSCREDICKHNAGSLFIVSFVAAVLIGLFSFFPALSEKRISIYAVYLITAIIEAFVAFYAFYIFRHEKCDSLFVNAGFLAFYICLIAFGMFLGIIQRPHEHSTTIFVFFIGAQILFVIDFPRSLILNLVTLVVYSVFSFPIKPFDIWIFDTAGFFISVLAGMIITRYMYYTVIKGIIATRRLEIERNRFREESIKDELTGLSNRRDYLQAANFYISACRHVHQTVCAVMMDVDFFKSYNDHYGHSKGDSVLRSLGKVLQSLIDEEHVFAARVGGEEFIVLWIENRIAEAERVVLKLRQKIIDLQIPHEKSSVAPYVTASLGMYILRGGSSDSIDDFYNNADAALYEAKSRGRNRIMLMDSTDKTMRPVELLPSEKNLGRR